MTYRRDFSKLIAINVVWMFLVIAWVLYDSARKGKFNIESLFQTLWTPLGIIAFFALVTLCGNGTFSTITVSKLGIRCGDKVIDWDEIRRVSFAEGFPPNLNISYQKNSELHKVVVPWPLQNPDSFKEEIQDYAPEGNPLRVFVEEPSNYALNWLGMKA